MSWNPDQYEWFKTQRKQPFLDLLALVQPHPHMRVADLGCGTGETTKQLHETLNAAETLGIDNSESMLEKARAFETASLHFKRADIATFATDQLFDLIFSNAALHWVRDHASLLKRLTSMLTAGGQLAIQMPANDTHPSHATAAEVARTFGVEPRHDPLLEIDEYARVLHALGFRQPHVRMQVYGHELESAESVIEWVKGTLLTDYEQKLGARFPAFLDAYRTLLLSRLGNERPYVYTYKRILLGGVLDRGVEG